MRKFTAYDCFTVIIISLMIKNIVHLSERPV